MFTKEYWHSSFSKLKSTRYLALMAIMIAMKIALSFFSVPLPIGDNLRLTFGWLVAGVQGAILGPGAAAVSGAISDIVGFMIRPTGPFFFGYTISEMLGSFVYGLFFYRKKITLPRIAMAKATVNYVVNVLIGSIWSAMLYSKGYIYYASKSLVKNTILLPFEIVLIWLVFQNVGPYLEHRGLISKQD